jgi:catechol 2,3-dioxygenase-like lactoylglutathione lyase family enzyme
MPPVFTHIAFLVRNLDRSIAFYQKYCQLTVFLDRREEGRTHVWLAPPTPEDQAPPFALVLSQDEMVDLIDHLGFRCQTKEEIDQIAQMAKEDRCLEDGPEDYGGSVGYYVLLRDPDGHVVEFTWGQNLTGIH